MSQALTRYHALYESLMSRRRAERTLKGLDKAAAWTRMKLTTQGSSLRVLKREAEQIDAMAPKVRGYSEAVLDEAIGRVRERFLLRTDDKETVREGMALAREVARRLTGEEAYTVQLVGALGLYRGRIVEMLTGEGKTLTGSIAAVMLAWKYRRVHVFTVNDYLAGRDAESREAIYTRCRLTVGAIQQEQSPDERATIYARHIVYGTPKQITADYLRDQLRIRPMATAWAGRQMMARFGNAAGAGPIVPGLCVALVDEADAVLIDEGVVPLIIARSRREDDMAAVYLGAAEIARKLDEGPDFSVDRLRRKAELKSRGLHRARRMWAERPEAIWKADRRAEELVRQALVARCCYLRGRQYEIVDGQVVIVDEYTGRFLHDRSWEHGLHQAVEAKEGLEVTADRETLARLSFQRFFRSYPVLCGMTGTAADAMREMETVYRRPVLCVPTNRPIVRKKLPTRIFAEAESKIDAIVEEIDRLHALDRPVLVGTRSIEVSQLISERLTARGLEHRVLNALQHAEESELVEHAGAAGAITVAPNMAGRGTAIRLDDRARQAGGLAVILTEMHGAKRIDRQFIGRSGRQGDPGSSQIFAALDDDLLTQHAPDLRTVFKRPGLRGELRQTKATAAAFRVAQRRSEARDRRNRAAVLRQDDWIDEHLPGS
ncbi:MAG: hypothetical protein JJU33_08015 [Phycisphaerales bacterium]|nr:hypothetical protein [Phycisphaerales bacterium]